MADSKTPAPKLKNDAEIDTALVRQLADILNDTDLTEIEVERGDLHIRVAREVTVSAPVQYGEQLKVIIDDIHSEFTSAADAHLAEAKSTLTALIYDVTKNVKPGSENAVQIIKTAIDNAFQGYEQVTQATRQAVQVVEAQIAKATEQVGGAAKAAASPAE